MGVAYLHLWSTQSIGIKGMYFETIISNDFFKKFLNKPCATAYTWGLVAIGRTYTNILCFVSLTYPSGFHDDKTTWCEGCVPWQIGPPFYFLSKKKEISIGNKYETHTNQFVWP